MSKAIDLGVELEMRVREDPAAEIISDRPQCRSEE
jgi:hypothetical protein